MEGSGAEAAGLQKGDVLATLDGVEMVDFDLLGRVIAHSPGR